MELFPPTVINSPNQFCNNINIPVPYNHIDFCTVTIQYTYVSVKDIALLITM